LKIYNLVILQLVNIFYLNLDSSLGINPGMIIILVAMIIIGLMALKENKKKLLSKKE
jgi:hypothetical protein